MRLPEAKIKEAILHPDPEIQDRAITHFAKSFSPDPTIMPLVIQAVETYGRQGAYRLIGAARELKQTENTITWVIGELNSEQCDQYENYAYNLSMLLVEADPALLLPREKDIRDARHFLPGLRASIAERLQMLAWDADTCWQKLEAFCDQGKDKQYVNEINLAHGRRIVEALARFGPECEPKVRALLSEKVEDFHHHPMKWLEPLTVRLAGQARLEATIPLLVAKLHEDADLLSEECADALTLIGTPAVLEAVAEAFPTSEQHFRLYATTPLEHIHSDLAVEKGVALFGQEREGNIQRELAHALLSQFAPEGIEAALHYLRDRELDIEDRGLRHYLLETCALMGERFPEYDEWLAIERMEAEKHWKQIKELEDEIARNKLEIERLKAEIADKQKTVRAQERKPEGKQKLGRNDPCPCGSGKKYKNCCLKKQGRF